MWRCARCGTRNNRAVHHCGNCGMPNPFGDGGSTSTVDIPPEAVRQPEREPSTGLPWVIVSIAVVALLAIVVLAMVFLAG